jgi:pimeloyl-ACP methyl ester carboxylesterase
MAEPSMKQAKGDGVEIQLAVWEGKGKTVLCVHGLTANCRCWDTMAEALAPDHTIVAMDLRGRGLSDKPPTGYSIDHHCSDILALLDDLEVEKAVLMGHSLGAFISLVFGAKHSDRVDSIILADGGGKLSEEQMAKVFEGIKPSLERLGQVFPSFEEYVGLMKSAPFFQPWSSALDTYFRYEAEDVDEGVRSRVQPGNIQEEIINLGQVDVSEFYSNVSCPVLILRATEGMLAPDDILLPQEVVERMTREIPDAKYVNIEGANHYTLIFQKNETRDRSVLDFLTS